jgi:hypothetical protein
MVNNCANPQCAKPLHYLREGRVFVFDIQDRSGNAVGGRRSHHLEHYWLCGDCSQRFLVEYKEKSGIRLVPRQSLNKFVVKETVEERSRPIVLAS